MHAFYNLLDSLNAHAQVGTSDSLTWKASNSYTVNSMYKLISPNGPNLDDSDGKVLHMIWHSAAPYRIQCFGWMAQLGRVNTADYLLSLGIITDVEEALCKFCGEEIESMDHSLLLRFPIWKVWSEILAWWGIK